MLIERIPFAAVAAATALFALGAIPSEAGAQTRPALTRDVDRPAAQPVHGACEATPIAAFAIAKCVLYTVPVGKRLVVELVSYKLVIDNDQFVVDLLTGLNNTSTVNLQFGTPQVYGISPSQTRANAAVKHFLGSQAMTFYLEENQALAAELDFTGGRNFSQFFSFSGYLVDK